VWGSLCLLVCPLGILVFFSLVDLMPIRGGGTGLVDQAAAGPIIISKSQEQIKIMIES